MKLNYGLIAVDPARPDPAAFLHFCGYEHPPTQGDREALEQELKTDPEFGLAGKPFTLVPAALVEQIDAELQARSN